MDRRARWIEAVDGPHHTQVEDGLHDHSWQQHDYATTAGRSAADGLLGVSSSTREPGTGLVLRRRTRLKLSLVSSGKMALDGEDAAAGVVETFAVTDAAAAAVGEWVGPVVEKAVGALVVAAVIEAE